LLPAQRCASAVLAVALCPSLRPSVCHKPVFCRNGFADQAGFWHGGYRPWPIRHCFVREFGITKIRVFASGTSSQTLDLEKFRHGKSSVASVVNLVPPTTVAILSHGASTVVYNIMGVTQRVSRVRLRQLRLVPCPEHYSS